MKMINFVMLKDFVLQLQSFLFFFSAKIDHYNNKYLDITLFLVSLHPNFV